MRTPCARAVDAAQQQREPGRGRPQHPGSAASTRPSPGAPSMPSGAPSGMSVRRCDNVVAAMARRGRGAGQRARGTAHRLSASGGGARERCARAGAVGVRAERAFRPSRPSSSGAAAPRAPRCRPPRCERSAAKRRRAHAAATVGAASARAPRWRGALSTDACPRETPAPTRALGWHRTPHMPAREAWPGGCSSASARGRAAAPRRAAFLCRPPRPYKAVQHGRLLHGRRSVDSGVPLLPPAPRPAERHFTGTPASRRQRASRIVSRRSAETRRRDPATPRVGHARRHQWRRAEPRAQATLPRAARRCA